MMNDEKRSLLAAALSFLVLIGWFMLFGKNQLPQTGGVTTKPQTPVGATLLPPASIAQRVPAGVQGGPEVISGRETSAASMEWTNRGARLKKIVLKKYNVDLLPFESEDEKGPILLCDHCNLPLPDDAEYSEVTPEGEKGVVLFQAERDRLFVEKRYELKETAPCLLDVRVTVENRSNQEFKGRIGLGWSARQLPEPPRKFFGLLKTPSNKRAFLYQMGDKVVHDRKGIGLQELPGPVTWAGIEDRYFLISLISRRISSDELLHLQGEGEAMNLALYPSEVTIPPQGRHEEVFSLYLGPKERDSLQTAGVGLEKAIDYGWFGVLAIPILKLLQLFHAVVRNWGVAILLLTLFIKILMNPLTIKSMKQMKEMQKLQPKLAELKEKYKNDRQRLNMETMQLFKTHQVNPMGGCLPMLFQMPIYIALYKVLYNAIELYHAPFFWFYRDLSAPDPYFILPILLGISMVAQQKLTPSTSVDPAQKQMMMIMPVLFTTFMLFLPVGLVLYILVNTVSGVLQQWMSKEEIRWRDLLRGQPFIRR